MRTLATVMRALSPLEEDIHRSRLKCLARVVLAALCASRLSLTLVGRALSGSAKTKHAIKRVDALLGNRHLAGDTEVIQSYFATFVRSDRPVLLIDWTDIGTLWTALVVTLVVDGRGLTLCWSVHQQRKKNSPRVESEILRRLSKLLPPGVRPVLVADAGFRGPWLAKVRARGWDFVARVRGRVQLQRHSDEAKWQKVKTLWQLAGPAPRDLGAWRMARYQPVDVRLVTVWKRRRTGRLPAIGRRKKRSIKSAREPWMLVTSLTKETTASQVVDVYALRMRIELTFRDQKCKRFGLGLDDIRTAKLGRAAAYVLLAALAHLVSMLVGAAAEAQGIHRDYQANTVRDRRVLSWARLGRELLRRGDGYLPTASAIHTVPLLMATLPSIRGDR